jgi:hypothetical protein
MSLIVFECGTAVSWIISNDNEYIHVCMYVCMYVCLHVCMYASMYVCLHVYGAVEVRGQ